jgi:hypothetical protein
VPPAQHTHNSRQHHKTYEELHIYDTHTYTNTHTHTHTHIKQAHYQLLASPSSTHRHPKETMRVSSSFLTTTAAALLLAFTAPGAHALDAADAKNLTEVAYIYTYPMMLTYKQMYTVRVCVCVFLYDALKRWPGYLFLPFPYLFHPFIHPKLTQTHTHTHTSYKNNRTSSPRAKPSTPSTSRTSSPISRRRRPMPTWTFWRPLRGLTHVITRLC